MSLRTMVEKEMILSIKLLNQLNSLSSNRVIENAVILTEKILKCRGAAFYIISEDGRYLRLVAQSHNNSVDFRIKKSIEADLAEAIKTLIESRNIFVNKQEDKELPKIMVPIVIKNKVRAALAIFDDTLEDFNIHQENIFETISEAVTNALINAYTYENAIEADRYINNTGVLKYEFFKEIIENKEYFKINNGAEYSIIKLSHKFNNDVEYLYYNLKSQMRGMDYIGLDEEGSLYLLLSNTSHEEAEFVIERLIKRGFNAELVSGLGF